MFLLIALGVPIPVLQFLFRGNNNNIANHFVTSDAELLVRRAPHLLSLLGLAEEDGSDVITAQQAATTRTLLVTLSPSSEGTLSDSPLRIQWHRCSSSKEELLLLVHARRIVLVVIQLYHRESAVAVCRDAPARSNSWRQGSEVVGKGWSPQRTIVCTPPSCSSAQPHGGVLTLRRTAEASQTLLTPRLPAFT